MQFAKRATKLRLRERRQAERAANEEFREEAGGRLEELEGQLEEMIALQAEQPYFTVEGENAQDGFLDRDEQEHIVNSNRRLIHDALCEVYEDPKWLELSGAGYHDGHCTSPRGCNNTIIGDVHDFELPGSRPNGKFFSSSWFTAELGPLPGAIFGQVDLGRRPFTVTINNKKTDARSEVSFIHEMLHILNSLFKLNMTHEQVHCAAPFLVSEVIPAYLAFQRQLVGN
jgi:hypothetical protein